MRITNDGVRLYGDNGGAGTGTLFAVYSFLEEQLGVIWSEPGDAGIAFKRQLKPSLTTGEFSWTPELAFRKIRQTYRSRPARST